MAKGYYNITGSVARILYPKSKISRVGPLTNRPAFESEEVMGGSGGYSESEYNRSKDKNNKINSMYLTNIHASDSVTIEIYAYLTIVNQSGDPDFSADGVPDYDSVADTYNTYYIIKNLVIPKGVTLKLDKEDMEYDYKSFDLYVKLSASDSAVDVIIK